jgi:hypothetical protein
MLAPEIKTWTSTGPGLPRPLPYLPVPLQAHRHRISEHLQVLAYRLLNGLHQKYRLKERELDRIRSEAHHQAQEGIGTADAEAAAIYAAAYGQEPASNVSSTR